MLSRLFFSHYHRQLILVVLALSASLARAENGPSATTDKSAKPAAPAAPQPVPNADGFQVVGFEVLASFEFTPPTNAAAGPNGQAPVKKGDEQIPERIKALDAQKVIVTGFMLPIKMNEGLVTEFLLVKDPMMCCFGVMPKINEWVIVRMTGKGVAPLMDVPISFEGKLKVGELYDNGYLTGIYLLAGERQTKLKE